MPIFILWPSSCSTPSTLEAHLQSVVSCRPLILAWTMYPLPTLIARNQPHTDSQKSAMVEVFTTGKLENALSPIPCSTLLELWFTSTTLPTIYYHYVPAGAYPKALKFSHMFTSCSPMALGTQHSWDWADPGPHRTKNGHISAMRLWGNPLRKGKHSITLVPSFVVLHL